MAAMTAAPKITIDQKISFRFFRLFSISCCICVCLLISFTTSGSKSWDLVSLLFLGIYCSLTVDDWGRVAGTTLRAPKSINNPLLSQLFVVCNKRIFFFLLHYLTMESKCREYIWDFSFSNPYSCVFLLVFCGDWPCYSSYFLRWIFKAIPISVCEKNLQSSNFCHKYTYRNAV